MKRKRILGLALAAVMALGLAACSSSSSSGESSGGDATGDLPTVGVLIYKYDDTYISTVRNAIETALDGKAEIIMQDGKNDQATQNDQLDVMIEKGVDVLCVNMVDAKAAQGVVDKAKNAGIPTIFFNREPDTEVIKSYDKAISSEQTLLTQVKCRATSSKTSLMHILNMTSTATELSSM